MGLHKFVLWACALSSSVYDLLALFIVASQGVGGLKGLGLIQEDEWKLQHGSLYILPCENMASLKGWREILQRCLSLVSSRNWDSPLIEPFYTLITILQ